MVPSFSSPKQGLEEEKSRFTYFCRAFNCITD